MRLTWNDRGYHVLATLLGTVPAMNTSRTPLREKSRLPRSVLNHKHRAGELNSQLILASSCGTLALPTLCRRFQNLERLFASQNVPREEPYTHRLPNTRLQDHLVAKQRIKTTNISSSKLIRFGSSAVPLSEAASSGHLRGPSKTRQRQSYS